KVDVAEEDVERPLVLLVASGSAAREPLPAAAGGDRRRERRARALTWRERVRQAVLEPEHLRAGAEAEPERRDDRRAPEPAAARCRRDHVPPPVDDVEMDGVASRGLADARRDRCAADGCGETWVVAPGAQLARGLLRQQPAPLLCVVAREEHVERHI